MEANKVLDRLAALLDAANPCFHSDCEARTYSALLNAAPALIRLARAAVALNDSGEVCCEGAEARAAYSDAFDAIKALGEVRL